MFPSDDKVFPSHDIFGKDAKHLKIRCSEGEGFGRCMFDAIAFGMGESSKELQVGQQIDIAYTIAQDTWNGNTRLQLKIKDIKPT